MANSIYLKLTGEKQGLISKSCNTIESIGNRYQSGHSDQIFIFSYAHSITREQNSLHHPISIVKPIDKSSPLLNIAISENEILTCEIDFYRTTHVGAQEKYYSIVLNGATLIDINVNYPHSLTHNEVQPEETLFIKYKDIQWKHLIAGTSAYSFWSDRVF